MNEAQVYATITVRRTYPYAWVKVDYATSDGTATAGQPEDCLPVSSTIDYVPASGTIRVDRGKTEESFRVKICQDSVMERGETVHLTLSNPHRGVILGSPSTAVLIIADIPDLKVDAITLDPTAITHSGGKYILPVDVTVRNIGGGDPVSDVLVRFGSSGNWSDTQTIASLAPGSSETLHVDLEITDLTDLLVAGHGLANVRLTATVDPDDAVDEVTNANNTQTGIATVDARPRILDVEYDYYPGWFMRGVDVYNEFRVTLDWNGDVKGLGQDVAGEIVFQLNDSLDSILTSQTQVAQTYNMGSDLQEGKNTLLIYAQNVLEFDSDKFALQLRQTAIPAWLIFVPGTQSTFDIERIPRPGPNNDLVIYKAKFKFPGEVIKAAVKAGAQAGPAKGPFGPTIPAWELELQQRSEGRGRAVGVAGVMAEVKGQTFKARGLSPEASFGGGFQATLYVDSQDKLRASDIFAIIEGYGKVKGPKWHLPPAPIIYVQLAGELKVQARLGAEENLATGQLQFKPDVILRLEPGLEAAVVVGEKGLAWAEGALGGKARGEFQFFSEPFVRSAFIRTYLRVGVGVLWFEKVQVWTWRWVLVGGQGQTTELWLVGQPELVSETDWQPMSRDYVSSHYATFTGDHPVATGESSLLTETYPYADPAAAYLGNGQVLATWVHDNTDKPQHQGLELRSALWNGLTWSTPLSVTNDLVLDFQPALAATGNGALAVWTRLRNVVADPPPTAPEELYDEMEIAYATYDAAANTWSAPQFLTDNSVMDLLPGVRSHQGQAMLLWLRDADNAFPTFPTDTTPLAEDLYYAVWDGTSWIISPTLALANLATAEQPQFVYNGQRAVLVWSQHTDGDPTTVTDTEIFYATWDATTTAWSTPQRLTDNTLPDLFPRLTYDSAGVAHLLWVQEVPDPDNPDDFSSRLYHATFDGSAWSAPTQALEELGIEELLLVGDEQDNLIAVWRGASDDLSDLYHSVYDFQHGSWSQPAPLTQDREMEWAYDAVYDDLNDRVFLVLTKREMGSEVVDVEFPAEGLELELPAVASAAQLTETVPITVPTFGRSDLVQLIHTPAPDLALTPSSITLVPTNPLPGSTAVISATVQNVGDLVATPVQVAFYDGNPASGGTRIGTVQTAPAPLAGGISTTLAVNWTVPITASTHTLYIVADPDNLLAETDETNNTASLMTVLADLRVVALYTTPGAEGLSITTQLANIGGFFDVFTPFTLTLRAGDPVTGTLITTVTVNQGFLPGEAITFTQVITHPAGLAGVGDTLWAIADDGNVVVESDETNNTGFAALNILPDLTLGAADIQAGSPLTVTVHNTGLITATNAVVEVRQDAITGTLLYSGMVASIAPGGTGVVTTTLESGGYTLFVEVDPANAIAEVDESNNLAVASLCLLTADFDLDREVTIADIMDVARRWGTSTGDTLYAATHDLDGSGTIDVTDIQQAAVQWRRACNER